MNRPLIHQIENAFKDKNYTYHDFDIFGIRAKNGRVNEYDDLIGITKQLDKVNRKIWTWPATTDPGLYWLNNPMNVKGTAIVKPGQYLSLWQIGKHYNQDALVQISPITVYRDNNRDGVHNYVDQDTGLFGINCHHADDTGVVGKWSAGCQVFKHKHHHEEFMSLCREHGGPLHYSLFNEDDIFNL